MKKIIKRLWQKIYHLYAIRKNVENGPNVHIGIGSILWAPRRLSVGNNVYIGKYCTVECDGIIGDNVMLANHVGLIGRYDHDYSCVGKPIRQTPWIGDHDYTGPGRNLQIVVGDDVWVGFGAVVLTGVTIGRGAIVAAGSVVTKDVEPYAIVAGNPARRVAQRFTENEIRQHESIVYENSSASAFPSDC